MTSYVGSWTASPALGLLVGGEEGGGCVAVAVAEEEPVALLGVSGTSSKETDLRRLAAREEADGKRVRAVVEGVGKPVAASMVREVAVGVLGLLDPVAAAAVVSARAAICLSSSESSSPKGSSSSLLSERTGRFLLDAVLVGHGDPAAAAEAAALPVAGPPPVPGPVSSSPAPSSLLAVKSPSSTPPRLPGVTCIPYDVSGRCLKPGVLGLGGSSSSPISPSRCPVTPPGSPSSRTRASSSQRKNPHPGRSGHLKNHLPPGGLLLVGDLEEFGLLAGFAVAPPFAVSEEAV